MGTILVAINPYQPLDIFSLDMVRKFSRPDSKIPHIFGLASISLGAERNQSILISGESGSGKASNLRFHFVNSIKH